MYQQEKSEKSLGLHYYIKKTLQFYLHQAHFAQGFIINLLNISQAF